MDLLEWLGYLASALIVVSLMMRSILRLRLLGLLGAVAFTAYGALIDAWPVVVANGAIVLIHLYHLRDLVSAPEEVFRILPVREGTAYLEEFCRWWGREIRRFQPEWSYSPDPAQRSAFVLRDVVPAGLVILRDAGDGTVEVVLDFVVPRYRDYKPGRFVFSSRSGLFSNPGLGTAWSHPGTEAHRAYLRRMGFTPGTRPDGTPVMEIDLDRVRGR